MHIHYTGFNSYHGLTPLWCILLAQWLVTHDTKLEVEKSLFFKVPCHDVSDVPEFVAELRNWPVFGKLVKFGTGQFPLSMFG
jgi:hypothetical protein